MMRTWVIAAAAVLALGMAGTAQAAGDVAAGEAKSKGCVGCHGADGKGKGNNPGIAGMDEAAFAASMPGIAASTEAGPGAAAAPVSARSSSPARFFFFGWISGGGMLRTAWYSSRICVGRREKHSRLGFYRTAGVRSRGCAVEKRAGSSP